jgi:hypothetical protein
VNLVGQLKSRSEEEKYNPYIRNDTTTTEIKKLLQGRI